jgi:hypothetical protein
MKYLHHVTAPIITTINANCYRGEPRWERNAFEAMITSGRLVHTTDSSVWQSSEPKPPNFHNGVNSDWQDDSLLITYGVVQNPHITQRAKYYMVQYVDGPDEKHKDLFLRYRGNIVATCSFLSWEYIDRLQNVLGKENVEYVPGPMVPKVYNSDNFNQKYLTWSYRNFNYFARDKHQEMERLMSWVSEQMNKDKHLRLAITVGSWDPSQITNIKTQARDLVLSYSFMNCIDKDRLDVFAQLHWYEMLNLFSQTKLIISPAEPFGGPPFEAAAYGIPTIVNEETNPFQDKQRNPLFSGLIRHPKQIDDSFLNKLTDLYRDHSYYRSIGDNYRDYVKNNATYSAFVGHIDNLCKVRNWS